MIAEIKASFSKHHHPTLVKTVIIRRNIYQLWANACLQVKRFLTSLHIKLRIKSFATETTQQLVVIMAGKKQTGWNSNQRMLEVLQKQHHTQT